MKYFVYGIKSTDVEKIQLKMNKKNKDIFDIFQKKISFCKKYVTKISEEKLKIEFSNLHMIRKEMNKL